MFYKNLIILHDFFSFISSLVKFQHKSFPFVHCEHEFNLKLFEPHIGRHVILHQELAQK